MPTTRIYGFLDPKAAAGTSAKILRSIDVNVPFDVANGIDLGVSTDPIKGVARVRINDNNIDQAVLCAGPGIMQYTIDGGDTWPYPASFGTVDPNDLFINWFDINWAGDGSNAVWATGFSTATGLTVVIRSLNGGIDWEDIVTPLGGTATFQGTAIYPISADRCYFAQGVISTIWYTADGGVDGWLDTNNSGADTANYGITDIWAAQDGDGVYAFSESSQGRVYRSIDAGATWVNVFNTTSVGGNIGANMQRMQVIPDGANTETVYLAGGIPPLRCIQADARNAALNWPSIVYAYENFTFGNAFSRNHEDFGVDPSESNFIVAVNSNDGLGTELTGAYYTDDWLIAPTVNQGFNIYQQPSEPNGPNIVAVDIQVSLDTPGCTDGNACNQDLDATIDDGSCTYSVRLTDCENPNTFVDTNTPEIIELACYQPRGYVWFDLTEATAGIPNHQISVQVIDADNVQLFQTNPGATSAASDLSGAIDLLIAYINNTIIGFSARRVSALNNPIAPGQEGGIVIISDDVVIGALATINVGYNFQLFNPPADEEGIATQQFDQGYPGFIVKVGEYPNQCWRVCGQGVCPGVPLTLTSQYVDCFRCLPVTPTQICVQCDDYVTVNSVPVESSLTNEGLNCVNAGQTIDIDFNIGFPEFVGQVYIPIEAGSACGANCPLELTFVSDLSSDFVVGTTITVSSDAPDAINYTIATSNYDSDADQTFITTVEDCSNTGLIVDATNYVDCPCNVVVRIEDVTTQTVIYDTQFDCVDFYVNQALSIAIPSSGELHTTITVNSCEGSTVCNYWFNACKQYSTTSDCHTHEIRDNEVTPSKINYVTITSYTDDDYSWTGEFDTSITPTLTFLAPNDDMYLVTITNSLDDSISTEVIYDLCDYTECYRKLVLEVYCNAGDPCCTDCDKARKAELEQLRYELNKLIALSEPLMRAVFYDQTTFFMLDAMDATRAQAIAEAANVWSSVKDIISRCGECVDIVVKNSTDSGCINC